MSKARQVARAERAAIDAERAAASRVRRAQAAAERSRRERRTMLWRRLRLWQHGPAFHRSRERWGALATVVLLVMLVVFVLTRSVEAVLGTVLVAIICAPLLVKLFIDRSRQ